MVNKYANPETVLGFAMHVVPPNQSPRTGLAGRGQECSVDTRST